MICYLDLDGVIVNFWDAVPKHLRFDLHLTADYLSKKNCDWWANLEPMGDFSEILSLLERFFEKSNIAILTALPPHSDSYDFSKDGEVAKGKIEWVARHMPLYKRRVFVGGHKFLVASKNHVLIDDSPENVNDFRKFGGNAILVNRPWNSDNHINVLNSLENSLKNIICSEEEQKITI